LRACSARATIGPKRVDLRLGDVGVEDAEHVRDVVARRVRLQRCRDVDLNAACAQRTRGVVCQHRIAAR
jgi:hypothetical protein